MAFPTIPTVAAGRVLTANQLNTTATRTFPDLSGLTKNSGDLLIAIVVGYQSTATANAVFSGWTGGFSEFADYSTTTGMCIGAAYKWSTGSETGTFAVTQAATITGDASMILLSIPGAHASTPPEAGSGAQGTTAAADPAVFNPTGWDVEDTLWISVIGSGMTSGTGAWSGTGATAPTNFSDLVRTAAADTSTIGDVEAAVSFRQQAVASQDVPAATGVDLSNARNAAAVIAVRPVPPPPAVPTDVRVSFATPATAPTGTQEFRALVRRKEASAPSSNPTVALELWESGAKVADAVTGIAVTSATGQIVVGAWAASALTTASGANVECKVVSAGTSGGTVEVGAIEWSLARVAGPTTFAGAATLTATSTLTVNGIRVQPGTATLSATSSLTANGTVSAPVVTYQGAVSLAATASLSANGVRVQPGAVSLSAIPTLNSAAALPGGAVSLSATTTLTAAGIRTTAGATALTIPSSLSVAALLGAFGAVALASTPTLSTNGTLVMSGFGSTPFGAAPFGSDAVSDPALIVAATLTVGGVRATPGAVSLVATGALTPSPSVAVAAAVNLAASTVLAATLAAANAGTLLAATGVLSVSGIRTTAGAVILPVVSNLASTAFVVNFGSVSLIVTSSITSAGIRTTSGATSLVTSQSLLVSVGGINGAASLAATVVLSAVGVRTTFGVTSLTASAILTLNPFIRMDGSVSASAIGVLVVGASLRAAGIASLTVLSNLSAAPGGIAGTVSLVVGKVLNVNGISGSGGSANLSSTYLLSVNGLVTRFGAAQLNAASSLLLTGQVVGFGAVGLSVLTDLALQVVVVKIGTVVLLASASFGISQFVNVGAVAYLTATALLQYINIFPSIVFGEAPGGWNESGSHVVLKGEPRGPQPEWTTDGIHAESTRAW